jgi:Helix-turn-helix domain
LTKGHHPMARNPKKGKRAGKPIKRKRTGIIRPLDPSEFEERLARVERGMAALERGVGEMDRTKQVVLLTDKLSLSPEQASALSGIELSSVREAVASGALVAHKHGVRVIILPDDLKAWLERCRWLLRKA